ncbi:HIT family protein [Alkalihalobacillus pseudalcaliphilus]|uniref:HIT family protein n=1 Tax=Alkalihalobacillus pseudalcaliphilus TaxID=79884 RepID=UPI00064DA958|nr:HIT domain-containing protein [Alkalihalobacillus pseudalcaliphilus]KMK77394.1 diadenosine tetraphosphate hydrolase [Alkalihalobacillus pseudalcaliphilus]
MNSCLICQKHDELNVGLIETEHWLLTHGPFESQILGYVYLEPRRHLENWSEMTQQEVSEMGIQIQRVEKALNNLLPLQRLYSLTISEAVSHIHVHLIPRLDGQDKKGLPLIEKATQQKTDKRNINEQEFNQFLQRLKEELRAVVME